VSSQRTAATHSVGNASVRVCECASVCVRYTNYKNKTNGLNFFNLTTITLRASEPHTHTHTNIFG